MSKLPVLMYHNFSTNDLLSKGLTTSVKKFEEQLQYLVAKNYNFLFASEINDNRDLNKKQIVLTFDDVTENQLLIIDLLKKYNAKATFFIPFAYIGKTDEWNIGSEKIMTLEQLKSIDSNFVEFGHHSFLHKKYETMPEDEINEDFEKSNEIIEKNGLNVANILAYPYGNYPKKEKELFFKILKNNKINMAFRIGNRVNTLPLQNNYEIQRIDIKGEFSMSKFKWKIRFGKLI